jgi:mRNA interferase MazF
MNPLRGEVWWVKLDPTVGSEIAKTRPCVIVTSDKLNESRRTVVVVPVSTGPRPVSHLTIAVNSGRAVGVAVIDQVRAVSKERFASRMGRLDASEMAAMEVALKRALGLV